MKDKLVDLWKKLWVYLLIPPVLFYGATALISSDWLAMIILLWADPVLLFVLGIRVGMRVRTAWWYALFIMLVFIPVMPIYLSWHSWPLIFLYGLATLLGWLLGLLFQKAREKQ